MAKKTKKRRLNARIKRTIRKTSAAVLMIVAILVAAIPAENLKATGAGGVNTYDTTKKYTQTGKAYDDDREPYVYKDHVFDDRTGGVTKGEGETAYVEHDSKSTPGECYQSVNPVGTDSTSSLSSYHRYGDELDELQKSLAVRYTDGSYFLEWQFKYKGSYLYAYNNEFRVPDNEVLEVPLMIKSNYYVIPQAVVDYYFESNGHHEDDPAFAYEYSWTDFTAELGQVDYSNPEYPAYILSHYFKGKWDPFIAVCEENYQKYKADCEAWENSEKTDPKPVLSNYAPEPSSVSAKVSDMTDDASRFPYFCDHFDGYFYTADGQKPNEVEKHPSIKSMQSSLGAFTLQFAFDNSEDGKNNQPAYLVKAVKPELVKDPTMLDSKGFLAPLTDDNNTIKYIGDYAFANVTNVKQLKLPTSILNIGDYAFANSFLESIDLGNVEVIGNAAFKNSHLYNIKLENTLIKRIGAEAFAGTKITELSMSPLIEEIHPGAFSYCRKLTNIDFSTITQENSCKVGEAAFYGCSGLNNINFKSDNIVKVINSLGDACLGDDSNDDNPLNVVIPKDLTSLPNHLFVGRTNLKSVTFPMQFNGKIPTDTFLGCMGLEEVIFPDGLSEEYRKAANPSFDPILFVDVKNKNFVVYGPGIVDSQVANPRSSCWECFTMVNDFVPYKYVTEENGEVVSHYEVRDEDYLLNANDQNELVSCEPLGSSGKYIELVIPAKVGEYKITSIKEGAFDDPNLRKRLKKITVSDGTLTTIPAGVFKNLPILESVDLGNSVNYIGDYAFADCASLEDVTFRNEDNVTLGIDAFATTGDRLTFHGTIREDYGPFAWAMQPDNYVNDKGGNVRVCYKQIQPYCLTVILNDAVTEQNPEGIPTPTLVDYPKFEEIDDVYCRYAIEDLYSAYSIEKYDAMREGFCKEWIKPDTNPEDVYGSEWDGPWINEVFCKQFMQYAAQFEIPESPSGGESGGTGTEGEEASLINRMADALLKPLEVSAAEYSAPTAYFDRNQYSIKQKVDRIENPGTDEQQAALKPWERELSANELKWLNACTNIVVPGGVKSIDAYAYFADKTHNGGSISQYFTAGTGDNHISADVKKMYTFELAEEDGDALDLCVPGLFSGYYKDGYKKKGETANVEKMVRGNDRIESIVLTDVEYLPERAFESCERLQKVVLGPNLSDIGRLPFLNCTELKTVETNQYYTIKNGLLFDQRMLAQNEIIILECLASRGAKGNGSSLVPDPLNSEEVALFNDLDGIADEAFKGCIYLSEVDLSSTTLETLPKGCFENCENMETIILPHEMVEILDKACYTQSPSLDVYIPANEVQIKDNAFESKDSVTFFTQEDSAAARYAKEHGIKVKSSDTYKVEFRDHDGTPLCDPFYISTGDCPWVSDDLDNPNSPKKHYYGSIESEIPVRSGYQFVEWSSNNPEVYYGAPITGPVVFTATYEMYEGTHDGKWYIFVVDGLSGKAIGERIDVEPDQDATELMPTPPEHDGYTFIGWSTDEYEKVQKDLYIIALYEANISEPDPTEEGQLYIYVMDGLSGKAIGEPIPVEYEQNATALMPTPPEHEGYTFTGWSTNEYEMVQKTLYIIALYEKIPPDPVPTIPKCYIYIVDGLMGVLVGERLEVDFGTDATELLPTPPKHDGYQFVGWSTDEYKLVRNDLYITALYDVEKPNAGNEETGNGDSDKQEDSGNNSSDSGSDSNTAVQKKYKVTVENGTGNGDYYPGNTVIITAANPPEGKVFSKWTTESQGVNFTNAGMMATTFKMPGNDVVVKANYVDSASSSTTPVDSTTQNALPPGYGSGYGTQNENPEKEETNAQVTVSKPGISNIDLATARVNGSSDSFVIKVTETNEAEEKVRSALTNRYGSLDNRIEYWSCDIGLYDETGNTKIEDTTGLTVDITLPVPDELRQYGTNNMVGAVAEGSLESLTPRFNEINGVPCVTFTATHFSPYTIYVDTQNLVASQMLDATPKTGDPIHPKWFLSIGLACVSILLFMKKDKKVNRTLKTA